MRDFNFWKLSCVPYVFLFSVESLNSTLNYELSGVRSHEKAPLLIAQRILIKL